MKTQASLKISLPAIWVLAGAVVFLSPRLASADRHCIDPAFTRGDSTGLPRGWRHLTFPKISRHTRYRWHENEDRKNGIKAEADASASALIREIEFDPKEYPILRWSWKVENTIQSGDETKKEGDDYAARVYVNFIYDRANATAWEKAKYGAAYAWYGKYPPKAALNYIWANKLPQGKSLDNAYTSRAKMVAVESGLEKIRQWLNEERNIYQDYISLFGQQPPRVAGVAVMTDADDTGETAVAVYADISFCRS
jgi:hypothetical protein